MTFEADPFRHFYSLPEDDPIEIPSDDDAATEPAILAHNDQFQLHSEEPEQSPESKAASAAFRAAITGSIPFLIIENTLRKSIQISGNKLLNIATALELKLETLSIDSNCLPSWRIRTWDPEVQSLHGAIQLKLMERQNAQELGPAIRNAIVKLGNERIQEAVKLGLELRHIAIGKDLLPTWPDRDRVYDPDAEHANSSDDNTIMEVDESVHSEDLALHPTPAAVSQPGLAVDADTQPRNAWSSETESEDYTTEPESDYDDEISLFNFVSQLPVVVESEEEQDAPLRNILHDVDVFGASFNGRPVDFEVYLAQNDPDVEQLPEVEMAIDEESFEHHHHHLADAVDIELADGAIYWTIGEEEVGETERVPDLDDVPEYTTDSTVEGSSMGPATPNNEESEAEAEAPAGWVIV
ncbi:hypothetical protein NLG97_g10498 [Lecanicillium saksenae]|uniref:Uncharacterized protein n=1 Tax=Lecanicillium saksenae TaxID=468837 RepID=A0ACC1QEQ0_9HYPO|nr:hypothetical protein NLG97_g10498 [Lecanicillium saksenae]